MSVRVVVVDDQAIARSGLRLILAAEDDVEVVGEAQDGLQAIAVVERLRPDVVLMDIRMPRLDGIEATRRLVAAEHPVDVIVITTFQLDEYVFQSLRAGAAGFLLKDSPPERIVDAVRAVAGGEGFIAPEVTRDLIQHFAASQPARAGDPLLERLTPRELEVLLALAGGSSNADIAEQLVLEVGTVKTHVGRVLSKLELRSRAQAVIYAYEVGLVVPGRPARPRGRRERRRQDHPLDWQPRR